MVFVNGLVLEEPTKDLAQANIKTGSEVCEIATEFMPEDEWIYDFSFPQDGGKPNPHLWTNPPMVKEYARVVRDTLVKRNPENTEVFNTNFEAFSAKVDALDAAMVASTKRFPQPTVSCSPITMRMRISRDTTSGLWWSNSAIVI